MTNHHFSWKWHIFLSSASRSAKLFLTVTAREVLESGSLRSQVGVVSQGRTTNVPALKVETNLISQSAWAPHPLSETDHFESLNRLSQALAKLEGWVTASAETFRSSKITRFGFQTPRMAPCGARD